MLFYTHPASINITSITHDRTMARDNRRVYLAALALLAIFLISTTLFTYFENQARAQGEELTYFDSVYWGVVTLSTVGYGDISAVSPGGRSISMVFILIGLGIYVFTIGGIASLILGRVLEESKGLKECKYRKHIVILGMDDVVEEAVKQLIHGGMEVAVVVESQESVERTNRLEAFPILGDPTSTESLEMANLGDAETVIINVGDDSKTIMAALACRKVNKSIHVVASIKERQLIELVKESGVESVISPQALTGRMLASSVFEPKVIDFVDDVTSGLEGADLREFGVRNGPLEGEMVGKVLPLLRQKTGTTLVALAKKNHPENRIANPPDEELIEAGDRVILLGYEDQLKRAEEFLGS